MEANKMTKTNKYLAALAVVMIFALLFIFALMLWPLYGGIFTTDTDEERHFYMIIDGVETDYIKFETLSKESFIIPFIKGEKLDTVEKLGSYNAYRWKIAPKSNTEYLIFEYSEQTKEFYIGQRVKTK